MSSEKTKALRRPYRKRQRAERERSTRERITAAAVALHGSVGPAGTTVKAIAERAGVERATVYRHFPDADALFEACTAHFYARHPMPDADRWSAIKAPDDRLRRALEDLYTWYEETEEMLLNVTRDAAHTPAAARQRFLGYFERAHVILMVGRRDRGRARARVGAAIGHAIAFSTWRSLAREQGLERDEAVGLMAALVELAAPQRPP